MNCKFGQVLTGIFAMLVLCALYMPAAAMPLTDTIKAPASEKYHRPSLLNVILLGKNYRKEWATPVCLPQFNLKSTGLQITELGGGMQTKSLYFKDARGEEWVLRTVDKDPSETLPGLAKNHFTLKVVQQMISAQHPYGALTISTLGKATGVKVASPKYYWVPDDAAFGKYREVFANTLCLFERKNVWPGAGQAIETQDMLPNLLLHSNYTVDQELYLRARLLDMLVGDWDRHQDQWVWLPVVAGGRVSFEALPKDRDQAYFYSKGLLVKFVRLFAMRHLVGFTASTRTLKTLNFKEWNMDRLFTNELTAADWKRIVDRFCEGLTDAVIDSAVGKLPVEISGRQLRDKLVSRRNGLIADVIRYYWFMARSVVITGSDEAERVHITGNRDSVVISMGGFKRTFYSRETKLIELFLLGGDDKVVCEGAGFGIDIRVDDGGGNDKVTGNLRVINSDMNAESREKDLRGYLKIRE